jgi:hypothetical protein
MSYCRHQVRSGIQVGTLLKKGDCLQLLNFLITKTCPHASSPCWTAGLGEPQIRRPERSFIRSHERHFSKVLGVTASRLCSRLGSTSVLISTTNDRSILQRAPDDTGPALREGWTVEELLSQAYESLRASRAESGGSPTLLPTSWRRQG